MMNKWFYISAVLYSILLLACDGKKDQSDDFDINAPRKEKPQSLIKESASSRVDLTNKGVGPVKEVILGETIDDQVAESGKILYQEKCTICHKVGEKFIGPPPDGILKRRSPEWVMNMMLNPEIMVKEDPLAKDLFMEYKGVPMSNQNLSREEARAILEYFRTL